tara:strand:- start:208 stop:630 length:423 start_codon:yes stop_codon:yes gene_type:complete
MKFKKCLAAIVVSICLFVGLACGQNGSVAALDNKDSFTNVLETEAQTSFHRNVIRAAMELHKKGEIKRGQLMRLRICMLSPAFRQSAEELAITQMVFSGAEGVPMSADGVVDRSQIDWDALLEFLEKLVPIILQIISIFG